MGPHQGRKVFTLKTLTACDPDDPDTVGKTAGVSLHAGAAAKARERHKLERLCRYITRPAVSGKRLSLTTLGKVRHELKTPYRDGTAHVIFDPLGLHCPFGCSRAPPQSQSHPIPGVFVPNSTHRSQVAPARRGRGNPPKAPNNDQQKTPAERHAAMSWAPSAGLFD